MSLIALASAKGSPGVTTTAVAVAGSWPGDRRVLLAEFDPAGGDLAPRFGLQPDPGVVELGAAHRRGLTADTIWAHTQSLAGGIPVLVGPPSPEQALALREFWTAAGPAMAGLPDTDVIVDCGRVGPNSPVIEILHHATIVVLVVRPDVDGISHLLARLARPLTNTRTAVVLVGDRPYSAGEVAEVIEAKVAAVVANDPRAAALLGGHPGNQGALRRSALMRSARELSQALATVALKTPPAAASVRTERPQSPAGVHAARVQGAPR
jgi:MinD-like ATPase involved in chromosome partitioning or flagellar assembly